MSTIFKEITLQPKNAITIPENADNSPLRGNLIVLYFVLFVVFVCNLFFVKPSLGGVPVRSIISISLLFLFLVFDNDAVRFATRINAKALYIIFTFAVVGLLLSLYNEDLAEGIQKLFEVHIQATVLLLLTSTIAVRLGARRSATLLIGLIVISCIVCVLQFFEIPLAWDLRVPFGFTYDDVAPTIQVVEPDRGPGLSYSTILLAGQSCIAFALGVIFSDSCAKKEAANEINRDEYRLKTIIMFSIFVIIVSVAGGNRSPILGVMLAVPLLVTRNNTLKLTIFLLVVLLWFFGINIMRDMLSDAGLRVAQTGDPSSMVRGGLVQYGMQLFYLNPVGYGLGFDSRALSSSADIDFSRIDNAAIVINVFSVVGLHNFLVTMLNRYGVAFIFLSIWCAYILLKKRIYLIPFVPYIVHILFHNLGPLDIDYVIWCAIGTLSVSETVRTVSGQGVDRKA